YESDREILSYVNLEIAPNQIIALVGGTGAGKSTLLSLVPRFYDPTAGRLTLDGRDIREITKKSLRQHIAIVLQDTLLFSTTVRDPTSESAILETIKDLMRGRTTIIITHRIATIHNVDQIVVLEGGRVVEQGRGPELVARGGVYAKLYASGKFNT